MIPLIAVLLSGMLAILIAWPGGAFRRLTDASAGAKGSPSARQEVRPMQGRGAGYIVWRRAKKLPATLAALALPLATLPAPAGADDSIIDVPVTFTVENKNRSLVPCDADGKIYVLHGSLVAPAWVLAEDHPAVTLYPMGGVLSGPHVWRMRPGGDKSFDYGLAMANLGHASVAVEMVGYGQSVRANEPDGNLVCQGSHADTMNQMVKKLRSGDYTFRESQQGPRFDRVALAGISYSSQYANAAVYSFPAEGNVDALILTGYAEPIMPSPVTAAFLGVYASQCVTGRNKYDDGSGPPHYTKAPANDATTAAMFNDPDPAAVAEFQRLIEADPCGQAQSAPTRIAVDAAHLHEITVPVLLANGEFDAIYGAPGPQLYFQRFSGSPDRTLMIFPGAGHIFWLEKNRATWIRMMAGWLTAHDL